MQHFYDNLRKLIDETDGMSDRRLSEMLGKSNRGYVSKMVSERSVPGADVFMQICKIFDIRAEELLSERGAHGRDAVEVVRSAAGSNVAYIESEAPQVGEVFEAWRSGSGNCAFGTKMSEFIELFDVPETGVMVPKPAKLGGRSIASDVFKLQHASELRGVFENCHSIDVAHAVAADHMQVVDYGHKLDKNVQMSVSFGNGRSIKVSYDRLLLRVSDRGKTQIANFSRLNERVDAIGTSNPVTLITDDKTRMFRSG